MNDGMFFGIRKVLVIDDSAIILRSVKNQLQDQYDVSIATSGEMGIEKAIAEKPDIILLDYEMPGMNGNATVVRLRQEEATKDIPVIFLTGVSDGERVGKVLEKHPAGYILKPLDVKKVRERIGEVLRAKQLG